MSSCDPEPFGPYIHGINHQWQLTVFVDVVDGTHWVLDNAWLVLYVWERMQTWKKMGDKGKAAALKLPLGPEEAALVGKALGAWTDHPHHTIHYHELVTIIPTLALEHWQLDCDQSSTCCLFPYAILGIKVYEGLLFTTVVACATIQSWIAACQAMRRTWWHECNTDQQCTLCSHVFTLSL